jgi:hypothetical protein
MMRERIGSRIGVTPCRGGTLPHLNLSEADPALLRDRMKPIDAVTLEGGNASYNVETGDVLDAVILKDRRDAVRAAVKRN